MAIRRRDAFDVALAAGLAGLAALSLAIGSDPDVYGPTLADYARPGAVLLLTACTAPLVSAAATRSSCSRWSSPR
jgi:hypothetical protein